MSKEEKLAPWVEETLNEMTRSSKEDGFEPIDWSGWSDHKKQRAALMYLPHLSWRRSYVSPSQIRLFVCGDEDWQMLTHVESIQGEVVKGGKLEVIAHLWSDDPAQQRLLQIDKEAIRSGRSWSFRLAHNLAYCYSSRYFQATLEPIVEQASYDFERGTCSYLLKITLSDIGDVAREWQDIFAKPAKPAKRPQLKRAKSRQRAA